METKKTWEYVSRVLIPDDRLSHCPFVRISNVKPAHASDDIYTHHGMDSQYAKMVRPLNGVHLIIYIKGRSRREI